jgi:hypothetical protein
MMQDLTWTCHVCGDTRPDYKIGVRSTIIRDLNGIELQENVRYCLDRSSCIDGSWSATFIEKEVDRMPKGKDAHTGDRPKHWWLRLQQRLRRLVHMKGEGK